MTPEHEVVWEFINPHMDNRNMNMVYRAYRVPYEWVPQAAHPEHVEIKPVNVHEWRVPGAAPFGAQEVIKVEGTVGYYAEAGTCVGTTD